MSILAAKAGQLHPLVTTFSGIAADGVARMAVRFVTGPEFTVPVIRNTYIASQVPQRPALMAVALDQQGQVVAKIPWPVPPTIVRARSPH